VGHFERKFYVEWTSLTIRLWSARLEKDVATTLAAGSFQTKKLCSRLFSAEVEFTAKLGFVPLLSVQNVVTAAWLECVSVVRVTWRGWSLSWAVPAGTSADRPTAQVHDIWLHNVCVQGSEH